MPAPIDGDRRRALLTALDLVTSIAFLVNSATNDEGIAQLVQPHLDEIRAILLAEIALVNHEQDRRQRRNKKSR